VLVGVYINQASVAFNPNCFFFKNKRLFVVTSSTYTVKVVVSHKYCKIVTLLLHTTNRKCHMAYRFVPFSLTLNDLQGY